MQVRFWGTRGSLPTSTGGASIREKIRQALRQAEGRRWETDEQLEAFIDDALAFPVRNGYGGDTSHGRWAYTASSPSQRRLTARRRVVSSLPGASCRVR